MAIVVARNTIFIRHLSPAVSETILRKTFAQCDVIEQVLFKAFPGRTTEYYAQIDFKSSKGVVEAHRMSGTPILGVVCQVSIMDPGSMDTLRKVEEARKNNAQPEEVQQPHVSEPQGVQAEYIRKYKEQAEAKRLRTVHVAGLDKEHTEDGLRALCTKFGAVEAIRMDEDGEGKPFALVEFKDEGPAMVCKSRQGFVVDGKIIVFTESKTLLDTNTYVEKSVHFASPFFDVAELQSRGVQSHLNPKLAKARLAAAEIMNEPVPEELKQAEEKAQEPSAAEGQPVAWEGRSEKDFLRELALLSRPRPEREPERSRRRRRRESRSGSRKKDRNKKRRSGSRKRSDDQKRRKPEDKEKLGANEKQTEEDPQPETFDAEDLELAVVPNTELLVLGESSSYSSEAEEDGAEALAGGRDGGEEAAAAAAGGGQLKQSPPKEDQAERRPLKADSVRDCAATPRVSSVLVSLDEELSKVATAAEEVKESVMDVDEKEQWLAPVDVDEEGSCDEIIVANDAPTSPNSVVAEDDPSSVQADATGGAAAAGSPAASGLGAGPPSGSPASDVAGSARPGTAEQPGLSLKEAAASGSASSPSRSLGKRPVADRGPDASSLLPQASPSSASASDKWECAACGEVNKAKRDQCNNCGGDAPWITVKSPVGNEADEEVSSASSPSTPRSVADSAGSGGDVVETRDVADSPARSVAGSGSARSVAESAPGSVADLDDSGSSDEAESEGGVVDLSEVEKEEAEECQVEAERVRGEVADARARIFHAA